MQRQVALELAKAAGQLAQDFSKRKAEWTNEDWKVDQVIPFGDDSAAVIFVKEKGKLAAAFFYKTRSGWSWMFPTDGQIMGMENMEQQRTNESRPRNGV